MIKSGYVGFLIFVSMMIVFFVLPDLKGLQKPFRILLGLSFASIYFALLIKKEISPKTLWPVVVGGVLVVIMIFRGTFQAAIINAYLCLLGLLCFPHLLFNLTPIRKINLNYIYVFCVFSILIQFIFFSSVDGRPSLAYQFNSSGAYLFLFFISSSVTKNKYIKILVIALSLYMRCRLLIYSILLFYIVRHFKKYFKSWLEKLNASIIIISGFICISFFSLWYVANIKSGLSSNATGSSRIVALNDDSNQIRFLINTLVIGTIYTNPLDAKVLFGFGPVENFVKSTQGAIVMPHNEMFDAIVEFGIVAAIFFALFSLPIFNKVASYDNIEYLLPILFHSLILYVRFLIVPSFEMLFILFILYLANEKSILSEPKTIHNAPGFFNS